MCIRDRQEAARPTSRLEGEAVWLEQERSVGSSLWQMKIFLRIPIDVYKRQPLLLLVVFAIMGLVIVEMIMEKDSYKPWKITGTHYESEMLGISFDAPEGLSLIHI